MNKEITQLKKSFEKNCAISAQGIGIDIEDVNRFRIHRISESPQFYKKIFTDREITYCMAKPDPYPHFTARFAAKEAVAKAVGMSMFQLSDIEIINEWSGRPTAVIRSHPEYAVEVSLSHTKCRGAAIALWL